MKTRAIFTAITSKQKLPRCPSVFNVFGDKTVFVRLHLISGFRLSTTPTARPSASRGFTPQATFRLTRRSTCSSIVTLRTFFKVFVSFHGSRRQEPSCVSPPFRRQLLRYAPRLTTHSGFTASDTCIRHLLLLTEFYASAEFAVSVSRRRPRRELPLRVASLRRAPFSHSRGSTRRSIVT